MGETGYGVINSRRWHNYTSGVKMRARILVLNISLLLISFAITSGCTVLIPREIEPCEVKVDGVYPLLLGKESVTYNLIFNISNPNSVEMILDTLNYSTTIDGNTLAWTLITDDVYIPANKEVKLTSAFSVSIANLISESYLSHGEENLELFPPSYGERYGGITSSKPKLSYQAQQEGIMQLAAFLSVIPLWKTLQGQLPEPSAAETYLWGLPEETVVKNAWDAAPKKEPLFEVEGIASFRSVAGTQELELQSQWQAR